MPVASAHSAIEIETAYGNGQPANIDLRSAPRALLCDHARPTMIQLFKETVDWSGAPELLPQALDWKRHLACARQ